MSSTTPEHCNRYSNHEEEELDRTFNFHHLKLDYKENKKWQLKDFNCQDYKIINDK